MKNKKILLLLLIGLLLMSVALSGCNKKDLSPDEAIQYLMSIKRYYCKVDITTKNDKQNLNYECRQFFDSSLGYRLEVGNDRVQIYKGDKIYVTDLKNNNRYTLDKDFDSVFTLSFISEYIKLLYTNESIKYSMKNIDGTDYELVDLIIPSGNKNLYKAVMYINIKKYSPEKIIVYDDEEREKVIMTYSDFDVDGDMKGELFNVVEN